MDNILTISYDSYFFHRQKSNQKAYPPEAEKNSLSGLLAFLAAGLLARFSVFQNPPFFSYGQKKVAAIVFEQF